ncbi:ABC transporter substrate-binding protein [Cohnella fermenti]|uniref:Fe/B12 periplasmic-binding domain-containing protein n=1 Tax=Cohnella fermenti TaxID=2565925 RepID=A0A4S4BRX4_9BACL|nr:ABC transporter substrate-binding protein [Cohnella fermenti]THF77594.1 hypothetical protein E6C55_16390 [Cohnella fermenti]
MAMKLFSVRKSHLKPAVLLLTGILMAGLLGACGNNSNNGNSAASTASASPSAAANQEASPSAASSEPAAAEASTRVFKDYEGHEVTIPTHPQRILVDQFMGHMEAVGVKPIGATENQLSQFEKSSFLKSLNLTDGVENLGATTISLEKALSLNPDLIILQENNAEGVKNYDEYAKIAPTVVLSYGSKTMFDQLREIADIVGESDKAEAWIAQYESKAAGYREQLAKVIPEGTTFTVIEAWPKGQVELFGNLFGRGTFSLYNSLQLQAPATVQEAVMDKEPSYLALSLETLPNYIGDYVFLSVYDWQDNDNGKLAAEFEELNVWRSLSAVKNDHVFHVDVNDFLPGDPLSIEKQLDEQARLLLEKFGNP